MRSLIISISVLLMGCLYYEIDCFDFSDCGSVDGKMTSVSIGGCSVSEAECALHSGTNASISLKFTSSEIISNLTINV